MAVVVSGTWSTAYPADKAELITKVTQVYGSEGDEELRAVAQGFLDDAIKELNSHVFEFNRIVVTGITLTAEVQDYTLPTEFYKDSLAYLVKTGSTTRDIHLDYLPWVHFRQLWAGTSPSDVPVVYSMRNSHRDGLVSLSPRPNAGAAADYTLTVEFYRRIPLVCEETPLDIPQEVETALLYGAQRRMAIHIHGPGHPDVAGFDALEQRALARLKDIDKRHPDQKMRFRPAWAYHGGRRVRGSVYIKVD